MKLEFSFTKYIGLTNPFIGEGYERLKNTLLANMLRRKDLGFKNQQDPEGNGWKPLSRATIAKRKKKGLGAKILQDKGILKNSLTNAGAPYGVSSTNGDEVSLGTNVEYAAIQNFGGVVLKPNNRTTMNFKIYQSGKFKGQHRFASNKEVEEGSKKNYIILNRDITSHKFGTYITIPARPFMGFGAEDQEIVSEKINAFIQKANK